MSGVSTYEVLRGLADSWGLAAMTVVFVVLCLWPFRPGARQEGRDADGERVAQRAAGGVRVHGPAAQPAEQLPPQRHLRAPRRDAASHAAWQQTLWWRASEGRLRGCAPPPQPASVTAVRISAMQ
jgi:cytochrome c oxidase cbb3-type subunit 4